MKPTRTTHTPAHPERTRRRRGRDALCALVLGSALVGALATAPADATEVTDPVGRYVMTDSITPGGPAYAPVTVANDLQLSDDEEAGVALPFSFTYYGQTYTDITVGANGAIAFPQGRQVPNVNSSLSNYTSTLVAPWWDDWDPDVSGQVLTGVVGQAPHRRVVVWWKDVAHRLSASIDGRASFQVHLVEGTNTIEFHYLAAAHTAASPFGQSGTIGIDNGNTSRLQYGYLNPILRDRRAIRFAPATCLGLPVTHLGTYGDNDIVGTAGDDVVLALGGNDRVHAGAGNDVVCGGPGADVLEGGNDADKLFGGIGVDNLLGQAGDDRIEGGAGGDHLGGGGGTDLCRGGVGIDTSSLCESRTSVP
jgi:Ca2+-binding RTX toxin-like protein